MPIWQLLVNKRTSCRSMTIREIKLTFQIDSGTSNMAFLVKSHQLEHGLRATSQEFEKPGETFSRLQLNSAYVMGFSHTEYHHTHESKLGLFNLIFAGSSLFKPIRTGTNDQLLLCHDFSGSLSVCRLTYVVVVVVNVIILVFGS